MPFDVPGTPTPTGFPAAAPLTVESSLPASARDERNLVTAAVASLPFEAPDPEGARQRRIIAIVFAAVLAVVIIVSIAKSGSGGSEPATPDAEQRPAVAVPEPPPVVPDAAERTVEPPPPPPPPDAAIVEAPKTVPQRLDDAIASRAWSDGVAVCKAEPRLAREDRARCAIIACNAREQALATTYYTSAPRSSRPAIEKACREQGISVAPRRGQDPCAADPLTCRK